MKKLGFLLASVFCVAVMSGTVCGQTTYTWNVPSGAWTSSGSWTPARTTPATNDVLVFDGATQPTATVTAIPRETIGQLQIINNAAVTFSSGTATAGTGTISRASTTVTGSGTLFTSELAVGDIIYGNTTLVAYDVTVIASNTSLTTSQSGAVASQSFSIAPKITISGGASDDLLITAGSSLLINTSALPPIMVFVGSGATGSIGGSVTFQGGLQRLHAADANAITFTSGATFTAGSLFSGNAFTAVGTPNVIVFASGSTYVSSAGSNPFGLSAPNSKVVLQPGSLYSHRQTGAPSLSNRTFADFDVDGNVIVNITNAFTNPWTADKVEIKAGSQLNWTHASGTGTGAFNFKGNLIVGGQLSFASNASVAYPINFNGTSAQTISGAGTISFNSNQNITINNANGVSIQRDLTIPGALTLTNGNISMGVNTLTATTVSRTSGHVIGNLRKAYAATGNKTFEVGTANGYSPVSVNITAGTFPTDFTVRAVEGPQPNVVTPAAALQRYWKLAATGVTADLIFNYLDADVPPPPSTENSFVIFKWDGGFTMPGGSVNTATNEASISGVSDATLLSDWTLAQPNAPTASEGTVSGTIVDTAGNPIAGAVVYLSGTQNRKFITDANGYYQFDKVETTGFYTVTPSRLNYGFSPGSRSFSQLGNNTEAIFTAVATGQNRNPLDTPEYFVRQHYLDFLGREPDEAGFNFWSDQILACANDADCIERKTINVSAAYFLSIEFQRTGGLIERLYRASYGRSPRYAEFMPDRAVIAHDVVVGRSGWERQLAANEETFVDSFADRTAFHTAFDSLSSAEYVETLVSNTGVRFTETEREAFVSSLNGGASRADVLQQIANHEGFAKARFNEAFVMMEYFGYLRRDPDAAGLTFWVNKLNEFEGNFERAEMVKAFINSTEYRARFAQ